MNFKLLISQILVFTFLNGFYLSSQTFEIGDGSVEYNKANHPTLEAEIDPDPKKVKKAWQDYLKDEYDVKVKGIGFLVNKDVLTGEKVTFSQLPVDNFDFYTKIVEEGEYTKMSLFAYDSNDEFLNKEEHPQMYSGFKNILTGFLSDFLPNYYKGMINDVQDDIENMTDEISDLESDITDNRDQIEKNRKEIQDLLDEIEKMESQITEKESRLTEIKEKLELRKSELKNINSKLSDAS